MEPYTMGRDFLKRDIIDEFTSCIWTERYYGDDEMELVVPISTSMLEKITEGTFIGLDQSEIPMIIETVEPKDGKIFAQGISLTKWLNNRFIRVTAAHEDRYWVISGMPAGQVLWEIVYAMCISGSPYLSGVVDIGIDNPEKLAIPNLLLKAYDSSGPNVEIGVPYGPIFDALHEIATTFEVGIKINLDSLYPGFPPYLGFYSYKGLDRTSTQSDNPVVRFSPAMDSLTNIKELRSLAAFKTHVYTFAPGNPDGLATDPGVAALSGSEYVGFDLRALMIFAEDITTDQVGGSSATLLNILNNRALDGLSNNRYVVAIDGEIVPDSQLTYGVHYNMGDIIEIQGNTGIVQTGRVTEYIRSQDAAGEKAYPTVTMI